MSASRTRIVCLPFGYSSEPSQREHSFPRPRYPQGNVEIVGDNSNRYRGVAAQAGLENQVTFFHLYERCMTDAGDGSNPKHKHIAHDIEVGDGIPYMRSISPPPETR
ncbi:unnamed protein product [Tilletia controversa]|nr:unnamed protein product [Tilletia controversa]